VKVRRIRLRNWRGVDEREVHFTPTGVTVVEGPNEAGKTSLLEALDYLLDEPESTAKAKVKAAKPVHRDEGPEVEADLEAGPYEFTYRKRFVRKPLAELTVRAPRPESLTGREAHDRVRAILEETTDLALWKALRIDQGDGLVPAKLGSGTWLGAALERAAGGTAPDDREETLFGAAEKEYLRWWTPSGKEGREQTEPADRVTALTAEVAKLREELGRIEADVARAADLAREYATLSLAAADLKRAAAAHDSALQRIQGLRLRKAECEKERALAEATLRNAESAAAERARLVVETEVAAAEVADLEKSRSDAAPESEARLNALAEAQAAVMAFAAAAGQAAALAAVRERDFEFRRDELDLAQLRERLARIVVAETEADAAAKALATNLVDEAALQTIRRAREEFVRAQAAADAARTTVRVSAESAVDLRVDGIASPLAPGERCEVAVLGASRLELPGVASFEVVAGAGAAAPRKTLDEKRERLRDACATAGIKDLDDAERAHAARKESERVVAARDARVQENLRDLSRDTLERKMANLVPRVDAWPRERPVETALPTDFDAAQTAARETKSAAVGAAKELRAAEEARDAARKVRDDASAQLSRTEGRLGVLRDQATRRADALAATRATSSDEQLATGRDAAAAKLAAADVALRGAQKDLNDAGADTLETLAANARAVAEQAVRKLRTVEDERTALSARLDATGESGVGERLSAKEAELDHAGRDLAGRHAKSAAAKLLVETLRTARDEARARYVAPFRDRIEHLGKVVFGPSLRIEVADDLSLVSRTVDDRTVPFDSLSGGAREQLGLIARLACAGIVEGQGGLPVVLDDALGFSDPRRLEEMGALLALAGRKSQVILLTCFPDRYRHVGGATVVRMTG